MKKLLLIVIFAVIGLGLFWSITRNEGSEIYRKSVQSKPNPTAIASEVDATPDIKFGIPNKILIPAIGVDAHVEVVQMDAKGNMDVPKNPYNVAWYSLGYKPGQNGSAVFAGHYDTETGSPAIFWDLAKLEIGNKITVIDTTGRELEYSVVRVEAYPYDNFPIKEVFGSNSKSKLNLITCGGVWDKKLKTYKERTVVFAELSE